MAHQVSIVSASVSFTYIVVSPKEGENFTPKAFWASESVRLGVCSRSLRFQHQTQRHTDHREDIYRGQMSPFDNVNCSLVTLYSSSYSKTTGASIQLQPLVLTWAWYFSCRCVEQMETSSDDYLLCWSQIWSVSFQNEPSNIWHLAKVTLLHESTFVVKASRWFISTCVFFTEAEGGIWSLSASSKCFHTVLENELFISVFSSELGVCVTIVAGYRTSIPLWGKTKICP